jgi:hypothetical protein
MIDALDDLVAAGRQAWARLGANQRAAWSDWKCVGLALQTGRDAALLASGAKTPHGKTYTRIFGTWLREAGFDAIAPQVRYRLTKCMSSIDAIEAWRAALPESQRNKFGHPDSIWFNFRRDVHEGVGLRKYSRPYRPPNANTGTAKATKSGYHRSINFSQDQIRRAGDAMRAHWCNDVYRMASIALSAALRHEADVLELFPPEPKPRPAPKPELLRIAAPVELELVTA